MKIRTEFYEIKNKGTTERSRKKKLFEKSNK